MKTTIGNTVYTLKPLSRGDVRTITALDGEEQLDELIKLSLDRTDVDEIPMADFMKLVKEATAFNGLDDSDVTAKKKS